MLTLPVELDASRRALELLVNQGIVRGEAQKAGIRRVLKSAAWTYAAGAVSAIGTLLYFVVILITRLRR